MGDFDWVGDDSALSEYEGYDWESIEGAPPTDALFRVLSHRRRRRILWFLLERPETTITELADVLTGWQLSDGADVGPEEHRAVMASLHHRHLSMLAESGLVTYDPETGAVRFSSPPPPIEVLIEFSYQYEQAVDGQKA